MTTDLTIPEGEHKYGPAMAALTTKQRAFVEAMLLTGGVNESEAARMAGYSDNGGSGVRVTANRLSHDPRVQMAMREEGERRLRSGVILGASVLIEIASDPTHKDRLKAANGLLARAGLIEQTHHKITIEHESSDIEKVKQIVAMAKGLGMDPRVLLGDAGVPAEIIDAEFTEVVPEEDWTV